MSRSNEEENVSLPSDSTVKRSRGSKTIEYPLRNKSKINRDATNLRHSSTQSEDIFRGNLYLEDEEDIISQESVDPASTSETIGFFILGLTTYFAYNVLVSSSHDLIENDFRIKDKPDAIKPDNFSRFKRDCNPLSTGTFLLINIVPELFAQILATFIPCYCLHVRMIFLNFLMTLGIILCALSTSTLVLYIGIGFISFSTGFSESTLISYISNFNNKHLIITFSSGCGSAGLIGSLWYVIFVAIGFSSLEIFYSLFIVPILKVIMFWCVLNHSMFFCIEQPVLPPSRTSSIILLDIRKKKGFSKYLHHTIENFYLNISYIPHLYPFIITIFLVYLFEYYINQCLHELIFFDKFILTHNQQYRWYQVSYNLAVFLVKTSLYFISVNTIWWFPLLQAINAAFLTLVAIYSLLPSFPFVLCFVFWEGLMGGFTYATIFCVLYSIVEPQRRKFSLAFVSISQTVGITCAALVAKPVHNFICSLPENLSVWNYKNFNLKHY